MNCWNLLWYSYYMVCWTLKNLQVQSEKDHFRTVDLLSFHLSNSEWQNKWMQSALRKVWSYDGVVRKSTATAVATGSLRLIQHITIVCLWHPCHCAQKAEATRSREDTKTAFLDITASAKDIKVFKPLTVGFFFQQTKLRASLHWAIWLVR